MGAWLSQSIKCIWSLHPPPGVQPSGEGVYRIPLDQEVQRVRETHLTVFTAPKAAIIGAASRKGVLTRTWLELTAAILRQSASTISLPGRGAQDMPGQCQRADSGGGIRGTEKLFAPTN